MATMRVLVVGGGAREHALAAAIARSSRLEKLFVAPGNPGTESIATNVAVNATDNAGIVELAVRERISLVVVGPEAPLCGGLGDDLRARNIPVFGPSKKGAALEGSKSFSKDFMKRHGIPTARYATFTDADDARRYVRERNVPLVVKADGLCAGKGVVVADSVDETIAAVDRMLVARELGDAGARVVIEDRLPGEEASYHVLFDGRSALSLVAAQDHKRIFDEDRGPNTGGMGAYAPAPVVDAAVRARVEDDIVAPTVRGLAEDGIPFRGVLFIGLMIDQGTPRVLEYNVRFGDPECEVLMSLIEGDVLGALHAVATGTLDSRALRVSDGAALAVVLAAAGYPEKPVTGATISGLLSETRAHVFHAGTKRVGTDIVVAGGRVLTVTASAPTFEEAHARAYEAASAIKFEGMQMRRDIGWRARSRR